MKKNFAWIGRSSSISLIACAICYYNSSILLSYMIYASIDKESLIFCSSIRSRINRFRANIIVAGIT